MKTDKKNILYLNRKKEELNEFTKLFSFEYNVFATDNSLVAEKIMDEYPLAFILTEFDSLQMIDPGFLDKENCRHNPAFKIIEINEANDMKTILPFINKKSIDYIVMTESLCESMRELINLNQKDPLLNRRFKLFNNTGQLPANTTFYLSNISHEIKNIVNVISAATHTLSSKHPFDGDEKGQLGVLQNTSDYLVRFVNNFLSFNKIDSGKTSFIPVNFSISHLIDDVKKIFEYQFRSKGLTLDVFIGDGVPTYLSGDADLILQVLFNLLHNALKFTEEGGALLSVLFLPNNDKPGFDTPALIEFSISDTGIGISNENLQLIFEPFFQEKRTEIPQGLGLGMFICRNLVHLMKGEISVESEINKGSVFRFRLELPQGLNRQYGGRKALLKPPADLAVPFSNCKILIAEDNAINTKVILKILSLWFPLGNIDSVGNGQLAIEMVKKKNYDIILMDIHMPVMDGFEATQKIREINSEVNIIAVTASIYTEEYCIERGMNGYFSKPLNFEKFLTLFVDLLTK